MPPSRHSFEEVAARMAQAAAFWARLAVGDSAPLSTHHAIGRPIGRTVGKDDMRPLDDPVHEHSLTAAVEVRVEQGCDR